ncbi:AmmeMemoRadiSam system radical SAM enzyme [Trichococcus collinsii]|uniref:Pyruvate formate lyase activating enzyme n=1 Tax=Trichococcus collinsii TaxID=157076 RepID=A0AB37ZZI3_9LACT|nr:AmmeMemoRadiSam system radical SAM enzyme [Trichococcus collinsii]CZR06613.1 radical sam [Trichococcus collinsii]SEA31603.1 pyruvate formate lyase activating enzyme [Trichococcus collinsii]
MKEAMLYEKLGDGRVRCGVCPHHCVIAQGKRGICAVRENREGTLYALNYGKAIAVAIDPVEKKPLNHFLPGTTVYSFATIGCNLRCLWCQNWAISQASKPDRPIYGEDISPAEHVRRALAAGCPSIAYTYTEPIIFVEYALDTMKLAREAGLKNIWKTAGYASKETLDAIIPYLDAVNVDLKGTDDEVYKEYCGGTAQPVLDTIKQLHAAGVHLEIATLVVPGVNDRIDQLERMARFIAEEVGKEVPWHVNRFFPGWKMMDSSITPMETLETAAAIGKKYGLQHVHIGNI